uniref:Uncharacterized protein n=1 Tax=Pyxicephalus adspersus TaxID=30357 RepID=A0AAV2ZGA0_PYXAD|nr:TPA: hypothetical protein GDO54_003270 [Pyxicephalus adspersus]
MRITITYTMGSVVICGVRMRHFKVRFLTREPIFDYQHVMIGMCCSENYAPLDNDACIKHQIGVGLAKKSYLRGCVKTWQFLSS